MCLVLLTGCGSPKNTDDYKNSLSVKQFLYDHKYILRIDGVEFTSYSESPDCEHESILELIKHKEVVSGMLLTEINKWHKFNNTDVYVKLFSGGWDSELRFRVGNTITNNLEKISSESKLWSIR